MVWLGAVEKEGTLGKVGRGVNVTHLTCVLGASIVAAPARPSQSPGRVGDAESPAA